MKRAIDTALYDLDEEFIRNRQRTILEDLCLYAQRNILKKLLHKKYLKLYNANTILLLNTFLKRLK